MLNIQVVKSGILNVPSATAVPKVMRSLLEGGLHGQGAITYSVTTYSSHSYDHMERVGAVTI